MHLYRITTEKWARYPSGNGGLYVFGHPHHKGIQVLYTATTRALAVLEKVVHVEAAGTPDKFVIITLELPTAYSIQEVRAEILPKDWNKLSYNLGNTSRFPASLIKSQTTTSLLADMGTTWLKGQISLSLKVPSAILLQEYNVLLNPTHEEMSRIKLLSVDTFEFDPRLL
jgi:RES domain-containing protein